MSDIAIQVENLAKHYRIGGPQEPYGTLRDTLVSMTQAPLRMLRGDRRKRDKQDFWALRDVSFEVKQGEVLGIIGRNGAGKSTLLKILSRITKPTSGRALIHGRVGSLLEVGTGFHPELTGRENIYLNGAILGMKKAEINRRFDEIVEFAEIEQFLDTPVKRYSSGMYMRLAFSIAAHLELEVLIVDEVLAVGDAVFQKKCIGKMGDVAKAGRTILFVSHNMTAIESLCSRCLLIQQGRLQSMGDPQQLVGQYLAADVDPHAGCKDLSSHPGRTQGSLAIMQEVALFSETGVPVSSVRMGGSCSIQVRFSNPAKPFDPVLGVVVKNTNGMHIFGVNNRFIGGYRFSELLTEGIITCNLENLPLMPGTYFLDLYFGDQYQDFDAIHEAITLEVVPADVFGTGQLPPPLAGPIFWPATWALHKGEDSQ